MATAKDSGAKILIGQHGGNYGIQKNMLSEDFERNISNKFCTWGWSEDPKTVPMPSPKLMDNLVKPRKTKSDGLLFISTSTIANGSIIYPFSNNSFDDYLQWQYEFISLLPQSLRNRLRFRTLREWGRDFWGPLKKSYPELQFENAYQTRISFRQRLSEARLFICDHLSTTFVEALASNKPTILFWDPHTYQVRDSVKHIFDSLHACGILHYAPQSAALEVEQACANVDVWWSEEKRQKAVRDFRFSMLKFSNNAEREWVNFFISESRI
jgi:putative transferase (TIGR04331 family)